MSLKALLLASLPLMVTPMLSLTVTPAQAASQNSQPQPAAELLLSSHTGSVLISDRYDDGDRRGYGWGRDRDDYRSRRNQDDYQSRRNRDDYQSRRNQDNYQSRRDGDDYRSRRDRDNYSRYRDRDRAKILLQF